MTPLLALQIVLIMFAVGVIIHAFMEMGRDNDLPFDEHEIDLTPFGKLKK